jgi:hypothetical protein
MFFQIFGFIIRDYVAINGVIIFSGTDTVTGISPVRLDLIVSDVSPDKNMNMINMVVNNNATKVV